MRNVLRRVVVLVAIVGALVAATSFCAPAARQAAHPMRPASADVEMVVLNNSWVDFTMYGRTSGAWVRLCVAEAFKVNRCSIPSQFTQGSGPVFLRAESRLWQKTYDFPALEIPSDAIKVVIRIQNNVGTSHIVEVA